MKQNNSDEPLVVHVVSSSAPARDDLVVELRAHDVAATAVPDAAPLAGVQGVVAIDLRTLATSRSAAQAWTQDFARRPHDVQFFFVGGATDDDVLREAIAQRPIGVVQLPHQRTTLPITVRLAHQALRRERERHAAPSPWTQHLRLLQASHDAVLLLDGQHRITFFNEGAERVFGHRAADLVGQPLDVLLPQEVRAKHDAHIDRFKTAPHASMPMTQRTSVRAVHKSGRDLTVDISIAKHTDRHGGVGFLAVVRDISERVRLEEELRRGHRMDAIGRLATGVVHDINNLLTVVHCNASLLHDALPPPAAPHAAGNVEVECIFDACRRGAALMHKLLSAAQPQALAPERRRDLRLHASATVGDMGMLLRRLLPANIRFVQDVQPNLFVQGLDATELEQVVLNLVLNARDAVGGSGRIELQLRSEDKSVVLDVVDDGCGMDAMTLQRATEPFFSTKGKEGNGVGLSTVYNLMRQSGGQLHIDSEVGVGTRMRAVFAPSTSSTDAQDVDAPAGPSLSLAPSAESPAPSPMTTAAPCRVWVLEADEAMSRVDAQVLRSLGYDVEVFHHGSHLLRALDVSAPDVLLLEPWQTPDGGPALAAQLRASAPQAGLVFLTSGLPLMQLGPAPYSVLLRPYGPSSLQAHVREALAQARADGAPQRALS